MNSSALYLAIVVVWLVVLVPMLLRRDAADPDQAALDRTDPGPAVPDDEYEGSDADAAIGDADGGEPADYDEYLPGSAAEPAGAQDADGPEAPGARVAESVRQSAPPSRARVIARRRRRTTGLTALLAVTAAAVAAGLGPWWVLAPPVLLLGGHLVLLREAAKADAEHRTEELRREQSRAAARRAARLERAEREKAEAHRAEIIDLPTARDGEVYDQYTDAHLRAAGD